MKEWALGFVLFMLVVKIVGIKAQGIVAWFFLTIFPYFLGAAIFELTRMGLEHSCR